MKLLLDENLPKRLKQAFPEFEVFTVRDHDTLSKLVSKIKSVIEGGLNKGTIVINEQ